MSEVIFFSENYEDLKELFSSKKLQLNQVEKFLQATNISLNNKLVLSLFILLNDNFLEKYSKTKKLSHLINEITNLIKDNNHLYQDMFYEQKGNKSYYYLQGVLHPDRMDYLISVLEHKKCPIDLLKTFSTSKFTCFRQPIAYNENCPEDILIKYSTDENFYVRVNVVRNHSTPSKVLDQLYNNYYQDYYNENNSLIFYNSKENHSLLYFTVRNPNCSADLLEKIFTNHLKNFNFLSLKEKMLGDNPLTIKDINAEIKDFYSACKKIINHPNSTPELQDKVIQKLLDIIQENETMDIGFSETYIALHKIHILEILKYVQKKSYELNLLPTTIDKIYQQNLAAFYSIFLNNFVN